MVRHKKLLAILGFISLFILHTCNSSSLAAMAIDFGHQFVKTALVKPSVPMEVVLNRESHRKTPAEIAIHGQERYFSDPAQAFRFRQPAKTYGYLLDLLGKKFDHPIVHLYRERFPYYNMIPDPNRGTVMFQNDKDNSFSVEELIGMQIAEIRKIVSEFAEQPVKDAIITVPAYFNQVERRAMVAAAKIGQVNLLQLMNDNTAVGVNYGMFRRKEFNETSTKIMIFDLGACHTTATIYEYALVKDAKDSREKNPQMTVLGVGFDRTLGGLEITMRLREYLLTQFLKKHPKETDIKQDAKAMNKLLKEAETLKKTLSANAQHTAQVESLFRDIDFRTLVTRNDLEILLFDFPDRMKSTVSEALDMAELNVDDLDNVVLMGGGTRPPKIQEILQTIVNGDVEEFPGSSDKTSKRELGKYLNTDEAVVMGAVYQAAHRSKGFKVKQFHIKDLNLYPIAVDFARDPLTSEIASKDSSEENVADQSKTSTEHKLIRRVLFPLKNVCPQKKKMTFSKHSHDFEFGTNYADLSHLTSQQIKHFGSWNVSKFFVSGVSEKVQKYTATEGTVYRGARVHFRLDESCLLQMESADLHFEKAVPVEAKNDSDASTLSKLGQKISSFFTGSSEGDQKKSADADSNKDENKTETEGQSSKQEIPAEEQPIHEDSRKTNGDLTNDTSSKDVPTVVVKEYIPVTVEVSYMDILPLSDEKINKSLDRIKVFEKFEKDKRARAKAQHNLESYVSDFKVKLYEDAAFEKVCIQADRDVIKQKLDETSEWSDEYGAEATKEVLETKLKDLRTATSDIVFKAKEYKERPNAIDSLEQMLNYSSFFLVGMKNFTGTELGIFTEVEMGTLEKLLTETQKWLDDSQAAQAKLSDTEKPTLTVASLAEKINALEREVGYLLTKAKYAKPKTPKPQTPTTNETAEEKTKIPDEKSETTKQKVSDDVEIPEAEPEGAEPEKITPEEKEENVETAEGSDKHTEL